MACFDYLQRGCKDLGEIRRRASQRGHKHKLQGLRKPFLADGSASKVALKMGIERCKVQQSLIDIKRKNGRHQPGISFLTPKAAPLYAHLPVRDTSKEVIGLDLGGSVRARS